MSDEVRQFVIFRVGGEEYGLPIEQVSSIIRYEEATPVPRAPAEVEGVINLRGRVVPVVDLARRFGTEERSKDEARQRIVVTDSELGAVGLAVDAASEVATVDPESVMPAPETALTPETAEAFEGVANLGDRLVILLKLEKAIPHEEYARLATQEGGDDV